MDPVTAPAIGSTPARLGPGILLKAILVALSFIAVITLHESVHLLVGRLLGVPAAFTTLSSVGISAQQVAEYPPAALAWMNGIAPLFTVVAGFLAAYWLTRRPASLPGPLRYFLAWWAIFGIPYLGLQLMLALNTVDYSGNGADTAAVAGYLQLPMLMRATLCVLGFLYYLGSAVWLPRVMRAVSGNIPPLAAEGSPSRWRRVLGLLLTLAAVTCYIFLGIRGHRGVGEGILLWLAAVVCLTPWKTQIARSVTRDWLLPGIIGLLALIPLKYANPHGNDYAEIWFVCLPPVFAAVLFAARDVSKWSEFTRIYRR